MTQKSKHITELMALANEVKPLIKALASEMAVVTTRMAELEVLGLIYAYEYWRKDSDGHPKYFYLLYPLKQGEPRRRNYIGCDPVRIEAARQGLARAKEYDALMVELSRFEGRAQSGLFAMKDGLRHLSNKSNQFY
ncbi:hypothetical protein [Methylomonas methanica]|uniref:Uncharacterized protein n=1 Tax=Methylomonas methanica TaxID=421 RepID=A0A177MR34_METMH|nr:hypothetical protein [Methylomonas methanica]OAI08052.1 hypothetical protein A1332_08265 [Methylomonas methanica]